MKVLSNIQEEILKLFKDLPADKDAFYLTGGTALSAFYLYHRKSNDLDFFTSTPEIVVPFSQELKSNLKKKVVKVERLREFSSFVELSVTSLKEKTIIHLALDSPYRFQPPILSSKYPGLKIDSLIDIASNKTLALFGRATPRDFIDLYFLNKEGFTQEKLITLAKEKDPGFDLYWFAVALERINSFSKETANMHLLLKPIKFEEFKDFFQQWRREIMKRLTSTK